MGFEPIQYKTTTRQQWEDGAEAWDRWGPTLEAWLGEATDRMLEAAGVRGRRGTRRRRWPGGQTLAAARRVGHASRGGGDRHLADHPLLRGQGRRAGRAD
jgi:hypothetical protein